MVWRLLMLVASAVMGVNGLRILSADDCETVSFDGQGGRVFTALCYPDSSGAIPAPLAGILLLAGAVALLWLWRRQGRRQRGAMTLPDRRRERGAGALAMEDAAVPFATLLLQHASANPDLAEPLRAILTDYRGERAERTAATHAVRRSIGHRQQNAVAASADSMVRAANAGGHLGGAMAYATFLSSVQPMTGLEDHALLPVHRAIAQATADAVVDLVARGRHGDARSVGEVGGKLFLNAEHWARVHST